MIVIFIDLLNSGKLFHSVIKNVLSYEETIIPPSIKSVYFSVQPILNDIQTTYALEENIMHPTLRYKGIVDCIASYRYNKNLLCHYKRNIICYRILI